MKTLMTRFASDESGATAIEYGLIAALIAVGIIAALKHRRNEPQHDLQQRRYLAHPLSSR